MNDAVFPFAEQGNFTQVHNHVFDVIMPIVSPSAFKVLCFVIRKTRGYHKKSDELSYSQILEGTGIASPTTISKAICELVDEGYILQKKGNQFDTASYALNPGYQSITPENGVTPKNDADPWAPENGAATTPKSVAAPSAALTPENGDTIRKYLKKEKESTTSEPRVRTSGSVSSADKSLLETTMTAETPPLSPASKSISKLVSLQPTPQNETELALCEISGVTNPNQTAARNGEEWPIALDVVQRIGASAEDLHAFRMEWFATPDGYGQRKRALFLSNIAIHLPQWMQMQRAAQHNATWQQVDAPLTVNSQSNADSRFTVDSQSNADFSGGSDEFTQSSHAIPNRAPTNPSTNVGFAPMGAPRPFSTQSSSQCGAQRVGLREQRRNSRQRFYREYAERFGPEVGCRAE